MRNDSMKVTALLVAMGLLLTACTAGSSTDATTTTTPRGTERDLTDGFRPEVVLASHALEGFDACDEFLEYVIDHAVELVGPYGLESISFLPWAVLEDPVFAADAIEAEGFSGRQPDQGQAFSGTNVQVEGVDEPDILKTDGDRIVLISEGFLIVVDVTGDEPEEVGRIGLDNLAVQSLFLSGDRALLFGSVWMSHPIPLAESDAEFAPVPQSPTIQLIEVDISGDPEIIRTMSIDGSFISGRMVGESVRLVVTSGPVGFEWSYPSGSGLRAERKAIEENREIIRESTAENWIPYYLVTDADGNVTDEGILFDCDRARHPEDFSGLDMLSVLTIDLEQGLDVIDATGVLAAGDTVYASTDNLYVATQNWQAWQWSRLGDDGDGPEGVTTEIHKFDITSDIRTEYVASGQVEGYLLNQFAMDEHAGDLRVASTTSPNWWGSGADSESMVTVLRDFGDELKRIGHVDGLGRTEQIYSVRFMGDVAYVVTFRQTDPLYTIDLSIPRNPRVVGELKILGYSAYLHPIGDGLLMGVGQDATDRGRIQGTQVATFDVSDLENPVRIDTYTLNEGSSSQVEYDHHAFLYWEPESLAMIPVQQYWWDDKGEDAFFGAVGLRVTDDGHLAEIDRVVHPGGADKGWDWRAQILRSIVIDDSVYTVSSKGIMKSDIDTLDESAWLEL